MPNWKLRVDECILPYQAAVVLLQQRIVNILQKMYSISYAEAYEIWMTAEYVVDQRVVNIINQIINSGNVNVLINKFVASLQ